MERKVKFILFSIAGIIALFSSCSKTREIKTTIQGLWTIDTIYYKGVDMQYCLQSDNMFKFDGSGECILPITENNCAGFSTFVKTGNWDIVRTDSIHIILNIQTPNSMFSGKFKIVFKKDDNERLLKMEIKSSNLYLVCRKGLYSYSGNMDVINDLVNISQKNN
jgi:hypothetical protein